MKTIFFLLITLSLFSCSKPFSIIGKKFSLYNDHGTTEMFVEPQQITFYKNDTLYKAQEYSGDLLAIDFTMPAGIWSNPSAVTGQWRLVGPFLEFSYIDKNHDSTLVKYIPNETYQMDWLPQ